MKNKKLHYAKKHKNDEFYTQLVDIERELIHYKKQLENKVIYCNCDNPLRSNFYKYFDTINLLKSNEISKIYITFLHL